MTTNRKIPAMDPAMTKAALSARGGQGESTDFEVINRAALQNFEVVLARLLPEQESWRGAGGPQPSPSRPSSRFVQDQLLHRQVVGFCERRQRWRSDLACRISRQRFAGRSGATAGANARPGSRGASPWLTA